MELYPVVPVSPRVSYRVQWSAGHCFSFTSTTSPQASTQGWNFSLMIALSITKYTTTTTTHFSRKTSPNSSPGPSIDRWRSSLKSASYWPSPTSTTQASLDTTLMMYGWKKDSWKYLGIIIDSNLNWNEHCIEITRKAHEALGLIQRTLHAASPECKAIAYKALVHQHLGYASTAWNARTNKNTRFLESILNNAAN